MVVETATGADVLAGMCRRRRLEISRREAGMEEQWTFKVQSVSRIDPEPMDDDGSDFAVVFDCEGPNGQAEVEVFVPAPVDEGDILRLAMSVLHEAFTAWARVTAGRHIANDDRPA